VELSGLEFNVSGKWGEEWALGCTVKGRLFKGRKVEVRGVSYRGREFGEGKEWHFLEA